VLHFQGTPFSHVQEAFALLNGYRGLARSFRLIMFDARGTGLSERDVVDVSATTLVADAEAVIEAAKLDRFVVVTDLGLLSLSPALRLALALPERITHLVFTDPIQSARDLENSSYGRIGVGLAEADWDVYVQTIFRILGGFDKGESTRVDPYAKAAAKWVDPEVGLRYTRLSQATDVGELLGDITQPTLVLMRSEQTIIPVEACQRVAAAIPGAQFRQYASPTFEQQVELIREFLGDKAASPDPAPTASGVRTVLFTDLVGLPYWLGALILAAVLIIGAILLSISSTEPQPSPTPSPSATAHPTATISPSATTAGSGTPSPATTAHAEPTPASSSGISTPTSLLSLLARLIVAPENRTGYNRDLFVHWIDADGDGCDTRREVLIEEAVAAPWVLPGCQLVGGSWFSLYDGLPFLNAGGLDIDHLVPLAEAWDSGASSWSADRRQAFANDLGVPWSLIAVSATSNRQKSDQDPADWMPQRVTEDCAYVADWIAVKVRWSLAVDPREHDTLITLASGCPGEMRDVVPLPAGVPGPSPVSSSSGSCDPAYPTVCIPPPPPDLDCGDISFRRFAVLRPDPHRLDGDGDGVGCES
jgi:pimeloyl-ACP methyl ester carboxylesterase